MDFEVGAEDPESAVPVVPRVGAFRYWDCSKLLSLQIRRCCLYVCEPSSITVEALTV